MTIFNVDETMYGHVNNCDEIVAWSGGLDSTLILHGLLLSQGTYTSPIGALSMNSFFLDRNKIDSEKHHRKLYIDRVVKKEKFNLVHEQLDMNIVSSGGSFLTQIMNWLNMAVTVASYDANIYVGVLQDDSQSGFIKDIKKYHEMLNFMGAKRTKLIFPLIDRYKKDVIKEVFSLGLENHVWFCETPKKKNTACCECGSCITFINNAILAYHDKKNEKIKEFLIKKLNFDIENPLHLRILAAKVYSASKDSPRVMAQYREISGN